MMSLGREVGEDPFGAAGAACAFAVYAIEDVGHEWVSKKTYYLFSLCGTLCSVFHDIGNRGTHGISEKI